jgi:hypothetical protein
MVSRLGRGLIVASILLTVVCVLAVSSRVASATYYLAAGDQLTLNDQCLSSTPNGTYSLCYGGVGGSGWYGVGWNTHPTDWSCSIFNWTTLIDDCVNSGYGSHNDQRADAGSDGALKMQSDGNLVLYTSSDYWVWQTQTNGDSQYCQLVAQDDGNLVLYYGWTTPLWSLFGDNS